MIKDNDIDYITTHYRENGFDIKRAWTRMGLSQPKLWTPFRIAAACATIVIVSATAAVVINSNYFATEEKPTEVITKTPPTIDEDHLKDIKVIDFEETPLPTVVKEIEHIYGVKVINLPENAAELRLSLHYEGTADDIVNTINDILLTEMTISKK